MALRDSCSNRVLRKAQCGLRQAADTESPYALSDRTRGRNGFSAAKSETRIAGQTQPDRSRMPTRQAMVNRSTPNHVPASDLDDQGEPIWLASGDKGASDSNSQKADPVRSNSAVKSGQPRQLPEIPNLPKFSQDMSEADIQPSNLKSPDDQIVSSPVSGVNANALELAPVPGQGVPVVRDSATATTSVAPALPAPSTIEPTQTSSTTTTRGLKDSANRIVDDGASREFVIPNTEC